MCLNGKFLVVVLVEVMIDWCEENMLVVMVGMVGSNVGWKVVLYLFVFVCFLFIGE